MAASGFGAAGGGVGCAIGAGFAAGGAGSALTFGARSGGGAMTRSATKSAPAPTTTTVNPMSNVTRVTMTSIYRLRPVLSGKLRVDG